MAVTGKQGMLLGRVKRILNIPDQEVKYRHKVLALVMLAGMIMLTGLLSPSRVSEQDRETTNVIAKQVGLQEPVRASLPFIVNISPEPVKAPEKPVTRSPKIKAPEKPAEKPVARLEDFDFIYLPEAPVSPVAPTPPAAPFVNESPGEGFSFRLPLNISDEFQVVTGAPDPRDRRSPEILRNNKIRVGQESFTTSPRYYQAIKNKAKQFEELEKLEGAIARVNMHPEQFYQEHELNAMVENMIATQGEKMKQRVQVERKSLPEKKITKPVIKTIPGDNGMTITIIQDEGQIEITVKDKRIFEAQSESAFKYKRMVEGQTQSAGKNK
jgi:hypothetical protein